MMPSKIICFPPAPTNGGPLEGAVPKIGDWTWQPKVDGWRSALHVNSRTLFTQYGGLSTISAKFSKALDALQYASNDANLWLDVELMENRHDLMRGTIIVLDWIEPTLPLAERYRKLQDMLALKTLPYDVANLLEDNGGRVRDAVYLINTSVEPDPMQLYGYLQDQNHKIGHKFFEGVVAKDRNSLYPMVQRRPKTKAPGWIKHRFDQ